MTDTLGDRVNHLREKLGKPALKNPGKQGQVKLSAMLKELEAEEAAQIADARAKALAAEEEARAKANEAAATRVKGLPDFEVVEKLDEEALIRPDIPETIRSMSERLLLYVHYVDESDKRTVGIMYGTIIALVRKKFPRAQTSVACLRWYTVHMRSEGKKLPQKRPRPSNRI